MRNNVIRAYAPRDNEVVRELLIDGNSLTTEQQNAITDVHIHIGDVCIKMSDGDITLDGGVITVRLGKFVDAGVHKAKVTVYSIDHQDGIAWEYWLVIVEAWEVCDTS